MVPEGTFKIGDRGPSVIALRNSLIAMGYLPTDKAKEGDTVLIEYFGEHYEAKVMKVGYGALLDPTNERPKS